MFWVKLEQLCVPLVADEIGRVATAIVDLEPVAFLSFLLILLCVDAAVSPLEGLKDELQFIELCTFNPPVSCCNH